MSGIMKVLLVLGAIALAALLVMVSQQTKLQAPGKITLSQVTEVWQGTLEVAAGIKLRLVLKLSKAADGAYRGTLDSVDQGAMDLPVDSITFKDKTLSFEMKKIAASYEGTLHEDRSEVSGQWTQRGRTWPLIFKRLDQSVALKELIMGDINWNHLALTFLSSTIYGAISLMVAIRIFQNERVLFRQ